MKIKYINNPKYPSIIKLDQLPVVAKELKKIQKEVSVITAPIVVDRASDPKSPLHSYFEWDDTKAAQKHREWQARHLIAQVYVHDESSKPESAIRAFVNVKPEMDDDFVAGQGYVAIESIVDKPNFEKQILAYADQQLRMWRKRFGNYKRYFGVASEIDKLK